jgi:maltose O-acetyltransferase
MTQRERMLAGERYNFFDPELDAERQRAKELLRRLNGSEAASDRQAILRDLLGHIGLESIIEPPFHCTYGRNTRLGDHVYLNYSCVIIDNNEVVVGDRVMVGPCVQMYTAAHVLEAEARNQGWEIARPIVIENDVWVGGGAILLPGVTIGHDSVVGAGAVVTRDVPPSTVVAGNPARPIRAIAR